MLHSFSSKGKIQLIIKKEFGVELPIYFIKKVMKKDLQMRYKKIKQVLFSGNSERNLILIQQFTFKTNYIFEKDVEIINLDES